MFTLSRKPKLFADTIVTLSACPYSWADTAKHLRNSLPPAMIYQLNNYKTLYWTYFYLNCEITNSPVVWNGDTSAATQEPHRHCFQERVHTPQLPPINTSRALFKAAGILSCTLSTRAIQVSKRQPPVPLDDVKSACVLLQVLRHFNYQGEVLLKNSAAQHFFYYLTSASNYDTVWFLHIRSGSQQSRQSVISNY